jgi:uncharacterized membrane protein (UPF0182 family)
MVGISATACALLAVNYFRPRFRALVVGSVVYVALYVIAVLLLPVLFQKYVAEPSELAREAPYLKHYIEFTRKAYQLDAIQETAYPDLTPATSRGMKTRSRIFACGTHGRCFRRINRARRYASITSSMT